MRIFLLLACLMTNRAWALGAGDKAPSFDLKDLQGKSWALGSVSQGKLVLLDFWASWCAPCIREIPALKQLQKNHGGPKFQVLGIAIEKGGTAALLKVVSKYKVDYPILLGSATLAKAYALEGFPMGVLVKDGKVLKILLGERKLSDFEREIAPYLRIK